MTHRYALTLGEQSEIHEGCPISGDGLAEKGFSGDELKKIKTKLNTTVLKTLHTILPKKVQNDNKAYVLHIKNGINQIMNDDKYADKMLAEQKKVKYDKYYFDTRWQKTLHMRARYNVIFGNKKIKPSKDYSQSSIIAYNDVPYFKAFRNKLPDFFGDKSTNLNAEGNYYYEEKSGIGFHGDAERKIVICASLGTETTLRYYWRAPGSSEPYLDKHFDLKIKHGDIYIMSEKASGYDWKSRSKYRLVHAAGNEKYININKK